MAEFFIAAGGVFLLSLLLAPMSEHLGLVDKPDDRKLHKGAIPLIGGIAMFTSITLAAFFFVPHSNELTWLLAACALITMTGTLDDRFNLGFRIRLMVQTVAALLLIYGANIELESLGALLGPGIGPIELGWASVPITVFAVVGMINAFNMMDGMDGLSGGLSLITAAGIFLLLGGDIADGASNILLLVMGGLSAYLVLNLHWFPRWTPKIFMGDAGSMLLGFVLTAFLIRYSQGTRAMLMPVTALWLVAVPLMDIAVTCWRRLKNGRNPFKPDRTHVHHIFLRAKLSPGKTLLMILGVQALTIAVAIGLERAQAPAALSLFGFLLVFVLYLAFIRRAFRTAKWLRRFGTPRVV